MEQRSNDINQVWVTLFQMAGMREFGPFDGRAIRLNRLQLRSDEVTASLRGSIALLVARPRLDVTTTVAADLERAAAWLGHRRVVGGTATIDGKMVDIPHLKAAKKLLASR